MERIGEILPDVMKEIRMRMERTRAEKEIFSNDKMEIEKKEYNHKTREDRYERH